MGYESFEALYEAHSGMVYWTAYGVSHSHETALDVTQTVFLQAFRNWDTLSAMDAPQAKSWVWRTARNAGVDQLRRRRREVLTESPPEPLPEGDGSSPEAQVIDRERAEAVHRAVEALPRHYREAVELHYYARLSQREAAEALGISDGTYRSRLARARSILEKKLKKGGMLHG